MSKRLEHFGEMNYFQLVFVEFNYTVSHRHATSMVQIELLKFSLCGIWVDIPLFPSWVSVLSWEYLKHLKRGVPPREMSGPFRAVAMGVEENDTWRLFHG